METATPTGVSRSTVKMPTVRTGIAHGTTRITIPLATFIRSIPDQKKEINPPVEACLRSPPAYGTVFCDRCQGPAPLDIYCPPFFRELDRKSTRLNSSHP